jgi:glutamate carboxypeptidase
MMPAMQAILDHLKAQTPAILADIERLVRLESPSKDVPGIASVEDVVQSWLEPLGACERIPHELGDTLRVVIPGRSSDRVVLLAHADTVYSRGFWDNLWRVEGDKVFGPGAYDMKGGIVQAVWALKTIKELGLELSHTVEFLLTPDEEIASHAGRPIIEASAVGARAVLVLEPPGCRRVQRQDSRQGRTSGHRTGERSQRPGQRRAFHSRGCEASRFKQGNDARAECDQGWNRQQCRL